MSVEHLASIYYGYSISAADQEKLSDEFFKKFVDDDWCTEGYYGQGFYYNSWNDDELILGIEFHDTEDVLAFDPELLEKLRETKDALISIYKEAFPDREPKEPEFLLISRVF